MQVQVNLTLSYDKFYKFWTYSLTCLVCCVELIYVFFTKLNTITFELGHQSTKLKCDWSKIALINESNISCQAKHDTYEDMETFQA